MIAFLLAIFAGLLIAKRVRYLWSALPLSVLAGCASAASGTALKAVVASDLFSKSELALGFASGAVIYSLVAFVSFAAFRSRSPYRGTTRAQIGSWLKRPSRLPRVKLGRYDRVIVAMAAMWLLAIIILASFDFSQLADKDVIRVSQTDGEAFLVAYSAAQSPQEAYELFQSASIQAQFEHVENWSEDVFQSPYAEYVEANRKPMMLRYLRALLAPLLLLVMARLLLPWVLKGFQPQSPST